MYIYLINSIVLLLLHYFFYKNKNYSLEKYIWIFVILFLTIFIGFRYEVGGDWIIYEKYFDNISNITFKNLLTQSPVFFLINKIAYYTKTQFVGVNFICSLIFMFSLAIFLKNSENKWLALAIAFPVIIVVLGMGYTRQSLAFSFFLFLIKSLEDKKLLSSFIYIILSILSHKSALFISSFLLFLYFWYYKKYLYFTISILIPIFFLSFFWLNYKHLIYFYIGIGQHMFSYGVLPRALLISLVAIFFIFYRKKFTNLNDYQIFIYSSFSILIIILFPFSFVASTFIDRLLLYLYPLKLVFISFANLEDKKINFAIFFLIWSYFLYLIVWISFGKNSFSWLPYKFVGF